MQSLKLFSALDREVSFCIGFNLIQRIFDGEGAENRLLLSGSTFIRTSISLLPWLREHGEKEDCMSWMVEKQVVK